MPVVEVVHELSPEAYARAGERSATEALALAALKARALEQGLVTHRPTVGRWTKVTRGLPDEPRSVWEFRLTVDASPASGAL